MQLAASHEHVTETQMDLIQILEENCKVFNDLKQWQGSNCTLEIEVRLWINFGSFLTMIQQACNYWTISRALPFFENRKKTPDFGGKNAFLLYVVHKTFDEVPTSPSSKKFLLVRCLDNLLEKIKRRLKYSKSAIEALEKSAKYVQN